MSAYPGAAALVCWSMLTPLNPGSSSTATEDTEEEYVDVSDGKRPSLMKSSGLAMLSVSLLSDTSVGPPASGENS